MFAPHKTAAASYRTLDVQTMVDGADPHRLVEMLYDGAVMQVAKARFALGRNEIAAKGEATTRAIRIIDEGLKAPLDIRAGDVARNLGALYDYMSRTLVNANLKNNDALYAEVEKLLGELRGAWRGIATKVRVREAVAA
ncbi:MAG TPA: flagellar export chaperone FliS [Lautropia sp.]|jgi:flagellar protein FliS|nr:flagellar export chaperone FliS [Lautropia sp.]